MRLATTREAANSFARIPVLLHGTRSLSGHAGAHRLPMTLRSLDRPVLPSASPSADANHVMRQAVLPQNPQTPGLCLGRYLGSEFRPHRLGDRSPPEPLGQVSVFSRHIDSSLVILRFPRGLLGARPARPTRQSKMCWRKPLSQK